MSSLNAFCVECNSRKISLKHIGVCDGGHRVECLVECLDCGKEDSSGCSWDYLVWFTHNLLPRDVRLRKGLGD